MATPSSSPKNARDICEAILRAERHDRIEKAILPSQVKIIDRLLGRGLELDEAYKELCSKLLEHPPALKVFFDLLLSTAAVRSPEANLEARKGRARLVEVNRRIEEAARELACLLNERTELDNHSSFYCDTFYHPLDAIHAAAENHYCYQHWVKEQLDSLSYQFGLKYWPSLSEVVHAVADDAARASPQPLDSITDAGTEGSRASLADSFRAFFAALEESSARKHGPLPSTFDVTDRSMASLMSCALDLNPDEIVDSAYVKRLRQRQREQARQN